jgi:phosphatidylglycerol:prolipoprotein diacylglycerol transferase
MAGHALPVGIADKPPVTLPGTTLPSRSLRVHPTQLYSAVNAGLLGLFLWNYYPLRRRDGEVFALLITIYPVARFLLEMIRIDESSFLGTGLSISQNVSLLLLALVAGLWWYLSRQPRTREFDPPIVVPHHA